MSGTVSGPGGCPLKDAELDMWQATAEVPGQYEDVHPGIPDFNLRGRFRSDPEGRYQVRTVVPAPYEIRKTGPTGGLFDLIGRSAWRPSHVHFKVSHPQHRTLTTQLFFTGGDYLDTDAGNAVKPDLIIPLTTDEGNSRSPLRAHRASYNFVLEPVA